MEKIDSVVLKESKYIAVWVLILSLITELVFLIIGKWDYTVLLGNILGACISIINFFLMGITLQKAVGLDEKAMRNKITISQTARTIMLLVAASAGCLAPCFNTAITIIALFFPRIAIALKPIFKGADR